MTTKRARVERKVSVDSLVTVSLAPTISDPDARKLLPTRGDYPIQCSVNIRGINNAIANAIRRVLISEMDNYVLYMIKGTWQTTDAYLSEDFIAHRVQLIPITRAKVSQGDKFRLNVENSSDELISVRTESLRTAEKGAQSNAFFETMELFTLHPRKSVSFDVGVIAQRGAEGASCATAYTAVAIPFDERPANIVDPQDGESIAITAPLAPIPEPTKARYVQSSSVSNPCNWQIIFESVGKGTGVEILTRAIESIIQRIRAVTSAPLVHGQEKQTGSKAASDAKGCDDLYTIKIPGETHTIGNLFVRSAFDIYTDERALKYISYQVDDILDELSIRFRVNHEPAEKVRQTVVDYIIGVFDTIKKQLA